PPVRTSVTPDDRLGTICGLERSVVPLSPSVPFAASPQQYAAPFVTAHACHPAICGSARTAAPTVTGAIASDMPALPLPSVPLSLCPQQCAVAELSTAHA